MESKALLPHCLSIKIVKGFPKIALKGGNRLSQLYGKGGKQSIGVITALLSSLKEVSSNKLLYAGEGVGDSVRHSGLAGLCRADELEQRFGGVFICPLGYRSADANLSGALAFRAILDIGTIVSSFVDDWKIYGAISKYLSAPLLV